MSARPAALSGVRVLDLAGPPAWYGSRLLADLGADVLRVEPPGGDSGRRTPPFVAGDQASGSLAYWWFNAGKRSSILDLESAAGRERVTELAASADIVLETFQPGWLAERGLGYEALSAKNPGLVFTSVTPFGQTGPHASWRGTDITAMAMGGLINLAGCPGSPPNHPGGEQAYLMGGAVASAFSLLALRGRSASGRGEHVDISLQDGIVFATENTIAFADLMGLIRRRMGINFFGGEPMFRKVQDGWIVGRTLGRWNALLTWFDEAGIPTAKLRTPEWSSAEYRSWHAEEIYELVEQLALTGGKIEIAEKAQSHRIVVAPVATVEDLAVDPQLAARDFWVDVEHARSGGDPLSVRFPGAPFKMSATPWRISAPAPEPGDPSWLPREEPAPHGTALPGMPLQGVRVLDLTWVIAGPATTQVLAEFGADVMKVESVVHADSARTQPLPRPPWLDSSVNGSGLYNLFNSSKRSISLDMTTEGAKNILRRLIQTADVIIDNYGVDPLPKWGLTPEAIEKLNPDAIVARASVMGHSGPRQTFIGVGYTIGAMAGLNALSGFAGDPPVGTCTAHPDYSCNPFHMLTAIFAALHYRERTGEGQTIDLSQHESTVVFNGPVIADYNVNGAVAGSIENRHTTMAPHGLFPCRGEDRWVAIACETDADWRRLAETIGQPELAADERFATLEARKQNEDAIDAEIAAWTRRWTPPDVMECLQAAGVPAGAVQTANELLSDRHLAARGRFDRVSHAVLGKTTINAPIARFASLVKKKVRRAAPILGQDSEDILRDLLGFDEEQLAEAYVEGVLQ